MMNIIKIARLLNAPALKSKQTTHRAFSSGVRLLAYQRQILSDAELDRYNRTGFIVLEDLLTADEKKDVTRYCDEIEAWPETPGKYFKYHETIKDKQILSRVEYFIDYHEGVKAMVEGKVGQAVADCLGEPVYTFKDKINFKMPGSIGYAPHQDEPFWYRFAQGMHITALIPADPMTKENGGLSLLPGDWKEGNHLPRNENKDIIEEITNTWDGNWEDVICGPGTVILFNSIVPHKSEENRTNDPRRAFYITWNGVSRGNKREEYFNLRRELYPTDAERSTKNDYSEGIEFFGEHILEMGKGNIEREGRYLK